MSNVWDLGRLASAATPSSSATDDKRNLIPPDPPDPKSPLSLAQFPTLSPTTTSTTKRQNRLRSSVASTESSSSRSNAPTVLQAPAEGSTSTEVAEMEMDIVSVTAPTSGSETTVPRSETEVASNLTDPITVLPLKFEDKSLKRLAPATISPNGRPTVLIPDSVFQKGADLHKDFIVCIFNGRSPPFSQIQSVLNHMWGKGIKLEMHNNPSSRSILVRITSDYLKQKILEKGYWYVGDSLFHTEQWTSNHSSKVPSFQSIQIWAHLTGIPLDLRHQDGLSLVAGLVGEPKETDDFTKNLVSLTLSHAKVEVDLTKPLPDVVEFTRQSGEVVEVIVTYPWLPPTCSYCKELGHIAKNCLLIPLPQKTPPNPPGGPPKYKTPAKTPTKTPAKNQPTPTYRPKQPTVNTAAASPASSDPTLTPPCSSCYYLLCSPFNSYPLFTSHPLYNSHALFLLCPLFNSHT
ncbi:hypothetical protein Rs2_30091 [Raphanus sativus]|nr:hypothetical protein Rs2_30091 [Raphanus sativus]